MVKKQIIDITSVPTDDNWDDEDDLEQFAGAASGSFVHRDGGYGSQQSGFVGTREARYGSGFSGSIGSSSFQEQGYSVPAHGPYGVLIRNLPFETEVADLGEFFERNHSVMDMDKIVIHRDRETNQPRGWATIVVESPESMQTLLNLDNSLFMDRTMSIRPERQDILMRHTGPSRSTYGAGYVRPGYAPVSFSREGMTAVSSAGKRRTEHRSQRGVIAGPHEPVNMAPKKPVVQRTSRNNPFGAAAPTETLNVWDDSGRAPSRPPVREKESQKGNRFSAAKGMDWGRANLSRDRKLSSRARQTGAAEERGEVVRPSPWDSLKK